MYSPLCYVGYFGTYPLPDFTPLFFTVVASCNREDRPVCRTTPFNYRPTDCYRTARRSPVHAELGTRDASPQADNIVGDEGGAYIDSETGCV